MSPTVKPSLIERTINRLDALPEFKSRLLYDAARAVVLREAFAEAVAAWLATEKVRDASGGDAGPDHEEGGASTSPRTT